MITIRLGKIFCDKYNKENGTSLSPKEIFRGVIAPLVWKGKEFLFYVSNDKFAQLVSHKKDTIKEYEKTLDEFCESVESDNKFNLMTSLNVYGGCAVFDGTEVPSTYCLINDNIYFSVDERYQSFIGMCFQVCVDGFNVCVYDENFIWLVFEGLKCYREFLDTNDKIEGRQLLKWSGLYISQKVSTGIIDPNEFFNISKKGEYTMKESIHITRLMVCLSKFGVYPKFFGISSVGRTNISFPMIMVNTGATRNLFRFYDIVSKDVEIEDIKLFDSVFGDNIIWEVVENGALTQNIITKRIVKYLKDEKIKGTFSIKEKIINSIMKKEDKQIAEELASLVVKCHKASGNKTIKSELEDLWSSRTENRFIKSVISLCNSSCVDESDFSNIIEYIIGDEMGGDRDRLSLILSVAKFKFLTNK